MQNQGPIWKKSAKIWGLNWSLSGVKLNKSESLRPNRGAIRDKSQIKRPKHNWQKNRCSSSFTTRLVKWPLSQGIWRLVFSLKWTKRTCKRSHDTWLHTSVSCSIWLRPQKRWHCPKVANPITIFLHKTDISLLLLWTNGWGAFGSNRRLRFSIRRDKVSLFHNL
jgi:hypothetical protein